MRRQFAPEYAHKAYLQTLDDETTIGDYTKIGHVSSETRSKLVIMIQGLHAVKQYRPETLYQALSLADRYLVF